MFLHNWRDVLRWAWSMRLIFLAGVLSGLEVILPLLHLSFVPQGVFAALSFVVTCAAGVARLIAQKGLSK